MGARWDDFIPATREIAIGQDVVYRPIRSWHSGTLAGERVEIEHGDRSGCMQIIDGQRMVGIPYTVTHRIYWNQKDSTRRASAFLSYPNGMGCQDTYFWETDCGGEITRWFSEERAEEAILAAIGAEALQAAGTDSRGK